MEKSRRVVFLKASPKKERSTSVAIGEYFIKLLENQGWTTDRISLYRAIKTTDSQRNLFDMIDAADLVVLTCPLYVDCLPSGVIRGLELIHTHRAAHEELINADAPPSFLAIVNCGFPESHHNFVAIKICHVFAHRAHFQWQGGLSVGMGGALGGHPLEMREKMAHHLIEALHLTADAITQGAPIPSEAISLATKSFMPGGLYVKMGNLGWNMQAKQNGVRKQIKKRPFKDA